MENLRHACVGQVIDACCYTPNPTLQHAHPCSTPTLATAPCAGEIIPQAVCSKHGLMIGSLMAGPVRFLMILTAPISWPVSKLLDTVLGGDHASLFRRKQLKVRAGREEPVYG